MERNVSNVALSEKELRKYCLTLAVEASQNYPGQGATAENYYINIANAFYQFIMKGKTTIETVTPIAELKQPLAEPAQPLVFSASRLLALRKRPFNATFFNRKMIEAGLAERCERVIGPHYKRLTEKGIAFGVNKPCPPYNGATSIYYYEDKFDELLRTLGL